jgi:uncharacterized protein (UPF0262 family)
MTAEPQISDVPQDNVFRIAAIALDETSVITRSRPIEQEREVAISDILDKNFFRLQDSAGGPYHLTLGVRENRLILDVALEDGAAHGKIVLSLTPFGKVIKDYFLVCDSYYKAIRTAPPHQIEALDMGRRTLHDEGSVILRKRLEDKVELDFPTARRLFTLICVLHLRG